MLDHLRAAGPVGTGDLAASVGISRPIALRRLRALEQAGLIRWAGKSQKDPRAVWVVAEE
jgi:ATP-dependent DNA helicase RecG